MTAEELARQLLAAALAVKELLEISGHAPKRYVVRIVESAPGGTPSGTRTLQVYAYSAADAKVQCETRGPMYAYGTLYVNEIRPYRAESDGDWTGQ